MCQNLTERVWNVETLNVINQSNWLKSPKLLSQRIRNHYYKTLESSVSISPSLEGIAIMCWYQIPCKNTALKMNKASLVMGQDLYNSNGNTTPAELAQITACLLGRGTYCCYVWHVTLIVRVGKCLGPRTGATHYHAQIKVVQSRGWFSVGCFT